MKLLRLLLLGFTLSLQSVLFFTPRVGALSQDVMLWQIQTGGAVSGTTSQEIILVSNQSENAVNITDWCIEYSAASNGSVWTKISCVDDSPVNIELWLEPNGIISFATAEFITANIGFMPNYLFSAGLAGTGGHLRLINNIETEVDRVGWGGAVAPEGLASNVQIAGKVLSRNVSSATPDTDINFVDFSSLALINPIISGLYETEIIVDVCPNIEDVQLDFPDGILPDEDGNCYEDQCQNIDELQVLVPNGYQQNPESFVCTLIPLLNDTILITEILPNSEGSDTGREFIELYNPNNYPVSLNGYELQIGPSFTKKFKFSTGVMQPNTYVVFSDSETNVVLPNTTGLQLRLVTPAGNLVSETPVYSNASDDFAWALIEDSWIYTNRATPAAANKLYEEPAIIEEIGVTTMLAPCPLGKYRNPSTNRCRDVETAVSVLTPCGEDESRNLETNRCRKNVAGSTLAACPAGQERNSETNRCRKSSVLGASIDDVPTVTDVPVENTAGQVNWLLITAALLGTFGYMAYEWRTELAHSFSRVRRNLVQ